MTASGALRHAECVPSVRSLAVLVVLSNAVALVGTVGSLTTAESYGAQLCADADQGRACARAAAHSHVARPAPLPGGYLPTRWRAPTERRAAVAPPSRSSVAEARSAGTPRCLPHDTHMPMHACMHSCTHTHRARLVWERGARARGSDCSIGRRPRARGDRRHAAAPLNAYIP